MEVFVINTPQGYPLETLKEDFKYLGSVNVVAQYENENQLKNAFPLTHVKVEKSDSFNPIGIKVQHLAAWEQIIHREIPGAIIVLDTVRLIGPIPLNIEQNRPKNSDICIFSAKNLQINGIHINGTDWVLLESDNTNFNNICNAYYITLEAAKKLYSRRNEMLNDALPFGLYINSVSHQLAMDRVATYMTMNPTSSKPSYIATQKA